MKHELPKRKNIRIPEYDYSQNGYYFITICTDNRRKILSKINNGKTILYEYGKIIEQEILKTKEIRKNVEINNYIVMPNHVHMIIEITNVGVAWHATRKGKIERGKMLLPRVVQQLKVITQKRTKQYLEEKRVAHRATPTVAKRILRTCN